MSLKRESPHYFNFCLYKFVRYNLSKLSFKEFSNNKWKKLEFFAVTDL